MNSTLPIGDFSRATHLSVKMLRHYHEIGLLEPVDVDVDTGYRRYATEQIVTAQIIRRFRDLDMPLEDIQIVLQAATLSAQDINPAGPAGGVFDTELFTEDRGRATIFLPCDPLPQPIGRVSTTVIPPAELATLVHPGPHTDIDRTYGVLAAYVTQHALAVDGPIREYYLIGPSETQDDSLWRTEVGWPIFQTRHTRQLCN